MANKSPKLGKNQLAWAKIFDDHQVIEKINQGNSFPITAKLINNYREARLMAKFDQADSRPQIFVKNNISILPVARGSYLLDRFECYSNVSISKNLLSGDISPVYPPQGLQSIDFNKISSEPVAINAAYISGVLSDFLNDGELFQTVSGRMGSGSFEFNVNLIPGSQRRINVSKSQMEIDAGYEGTNSLALIEAKNFLAESFNIRQLYYPFRYWNERIEKKVRSIYQLYSNSTFYFYEFDFQTPTEMNSLKLIHSKIYQIRDRTISTQEIYDILCAIDVDNSNTVNFPQADKFDRVISLLEFVGANKSAYQIEITEKYEFDKRQTSYYADAALYLGLIEKGRDKFGVFYTLSKLGSSILKLPYADRQLAFTKQILSRSVFYDSMVFYFTELAEPSNDFIIEKMKTYKVKGIRKESTYRRRADTVLAWLNWILAISDDD